MEEEIWKKVAAENQMQWHETLGSRPYDAIEKSDLFLLKKKVGFATCGKPGELPKSSNDNTGYTKEQLESIKAICNKIIEKSENDPVQFACVVLVLYKNKVICNTPIFRITQTSGKIFIDTHARVYKNWEHFMKKNVLPDCEYCFPLDGEYKVNDEKQLQVGFAYSPASGLIRKAADCIDTVGSVASITTASVIAAGMFFTMAPVVGTVAGTTAVCTGVYSVSRNVGHLYDRIKHEQTIGLRDRESRSNWISLVSSTVGVATFAAVSKAQKIYESGKSLTKLGLYGLHTLNATSAIFSGFGFVDSLIICINKYKNGTITKKDMFDLSCELMFLFNAIASVKSTAEFVNKMTITAMETPSTQIKLSKTQKRNLRKRMHKRQSKADNAKADNAKADQSSSEIVSTSMQFVLLEAAKYFSPKLEDILYSVKSMGHDIISWRRGEISDHHVITNTYKKLSHLYNEYMTDVSDVFMKMSKYITSLSNVNIKEVIKIWFEKASKEMKTIFSTRVMNMEDHVDRLITDTEREISVLEESSGLIDTSSLSETPADETNDLDDDNLSPEAQSLLSGCGDVMEALSWSCDDLEEFGSLLDTVKYSFISEFKEKLDNYKKFIEAAKSTSGDSFDLKRYNTSLGIREDVTQHYFEETLTNLTSSKSLWKIQTKYVQLQKERVARTTPVWEGLTEGMFHYFGPHGAGYLPKSELLSIIGKVVKIPLIEDSYELLEHNNVLIIKINNNPDMNIVVYCGITEENTASGVICVLN